MKKLTFVLILVIFSLTENSLYATKWRVNNSGVPADFTTAQAVINSSSVMNGDTVYFESSMTDYGNMTLTKRLVVIGPGYFLSENDSTQAEMKPATLSLVIFTDGSQGSIIKGMTFVSYTSIQVSRITLENNNLSDLYVSGGTGHIIIRNYIYYVIINNNSDNVLLCSNIITRSANNNLYPSISMSYASATIMNNIFLGYIYISNSIFRNNISLSTSAPDCFVPTNCLIENNIGASTQFGTENGNQQNVDMSTVFMNTGSTDGKYILKAGSPAIGAGTGGTDCGIFGGNYPYQLSGIGSMPSVWYMNMNGNNVTVKAKSH